MKKNYEKNPQVKKAAVKLRELSADELIRDMLERREKGRRDFVAFMKDAKREGYAEGRADVAREMLKNNLQIDEIIKMTGLTHDEIEAL